eukprot:3245485-Rhodomonas_salina.3
MSAPDLAQQMRCLGTGACIVGASSVSCPHQQTTDDEACATFAALAVDGDDVAVVELHPPCGRLAGVDEFGKERRAVVFDRDAQHLVEQSTR